MSADLPNPPLTDNEAAMYARAAQKVELTAVVEYAIGFITRVQEYASFNRADYRVPGPMEKEAGVLMAMLRAALDATPPPALDEQELARRMLAVDPYEQFYIGAVRVHADVFARAILATSTDTPE